MNVQQAFLMFHQVAAANTSTHLCFLLQLVAYIKRRKRVTAQMFLFFFENCIISLSLKEKQKQ